MKPRNNVKLVVALEHHFVRCPEGVFTSLAFGYSFWQEYLQIFDQVCVVARMSCADEPPENTFVASGENVEFYDLPDYFGVRDFICKLGPTMWKVLGTHKLGDCFMLFSGNIGVIVWLNLLFHCRFKYYFRCVGNVRLGIATENKNFMYKYIAYLYHCLTKIQAKYARASSYTSNYLFEVYPNKKHYVFSNVELTENVFSQPRQIDFFRRQPFRFISVGRVEKQKGHAWFLEAVKLLKEKTPQLNWHVCVVGPGSQIDILRDYVVKNQLQEQITFTGSVKWGEALFQLLDESHVFVLPSLTEGMSRALLEGMARGLPAIASRTGGNPEIVHEDYLVEVGDVSALAQKMLDVISQPQQLVDLSQRNWQVARSFKQNFVKQDFLRYIHENSSSS
ncbi:glycosyltransferase family 4 protein [Candidatus Uabimicrobium sp. HlEnr_7]|uniref:glycosyltransferase family 4 protein n=1 Tax=Candidatus Uabimicrobium helgolandensis TaxID=3095367 RepID=UPI003556C0FA